MEQTTQAPPELHTEARPPEVRDDPAAKRQAGSVRLRRSAFKNPKVKWALVFLVLLMLAGGFLLWRHFASYESTDDAQVDGHVVPVSARVGGHVQKLNVSDNQFVKAGTVLVEIDPADYEVSLERAQANHQDALAGAKAASVNVPIAGVSTSSQLTTAQAALRTAQAGISAAQQQVQAALAQLQQAEANNARAQSDLARYKQLVDKQEISALQYDQAVASAKSNAAAVIAARASADAAQQQVAQAQARAAQAEAEVRSANTFPQQMTAMRSKAEAAQAVAAQRRADLDQAKLNLRYTKVLAPTDGVVSNRSVEVGQNVQPGQMMMMIISLEDLWVTANFKETQLKHMAVDQKAKIYVDATDKDYDGHVDSLAGASGARFSLLPPENATGNYVKVVQRVPVKIVLEPGQDPEHRLRPGMSAGPKIYIK